MQFFQTKPMKVLKILQQMCIQLRNLTETYLQVCMTLEEISVLEENDSYENEVLTKLEFIHETQLCSCMYDISDCRNYWYDHFNITMGG